MNFMNFRVSRNFFTKCCCVMFCESFLLQKFLVIWYTGSAEWEHQVKESVRQDRACLEQ